MYIVVARHGERWDYLQTSAGHNWVATAERPWDPPLSPQGLLQAKRMGEYLSTLLDERELPPLTACYSSPFLRCRQTSCQAVEAYNRQNERNLKVQIEWGLSESINKSWYRSWALPGADGTWGYIPPNEKPVRGLDAFRDEELHPESRRPVQHLLEWKEVTHPDSPNLEFLQDREYVSSTTIDQPFALKPTVLVETAQEQAERIKQVVTNKAVKDQTILLVSHGGPVTHLFEKLTGKDWKEHGESKYCCISIYQCKSEDEWEPLLVNESKYLEDLWSDGTANI